MTTATTVREQPILFSGPMVRAIIEGRKTQTRRVVTDRNSQGNVRASGLDLTRAWVDPGPSPAGNVGPYLKAPVIGRANAGIIERLYPRIVDPDRLWVRENLCQDPLDGIWKYQADFEPLVDSSDPIDAVAWVVTRERTYCPSIHMPRWACRLVLEVTSVRVERLQQISEADALAEGVLRVRDGCYVVRGTRQDAAGLGHSSAEVAFACGWNELNESRGFGWAENPWVWVISFRRIEA